jgi:23S rRNA pseudouridine2605 synthase
MALERLQKIIAAAGLAPRRQAETMITAGRVTVNGEIIRVLGSKADPEKDHIKVDGKLLQMPRKVYLVLNKPRGCLSTVSDPEGRPTVLDLVKPHREVYPVGRLDYNSEGLLLLTNDGDFARLITSAGSHCPKTYEVKVRGIPTPETLEKMRHGMRYPDGRGLAPVGVEALRREKQSRNAWFRMRLHEGKKNQIRNMFKLAGHSVVKLRRTAIGFLHENRLGPGEWRALSPGEVKQFFSLAPAASGDAPKRPPVKPRRKPSFRPARAKE